MTDTITLTGLVATEPRHVKTGEGLPITSFRLVSSQSHYDRASGSWVDSDSNWYTISTFRRLALGAATSIRKGDRVVVTGKLRIRDWKSTDRNGTTIEVNADALGHDLTWGTATFTRTLSAAAAAEERQREEGTADTQGFRPTESGPLEHGADVQPSTSWPSATPGSAEPPSVSVPVSVPVPLPVPAPDDGGWGAPMVPIPRGATDSDPAGTYPALRAVEDPLADPPF